MPQASAWLPLLLGVTVVAVTFLAQLLFPSESSKWLAIGGMYVVIGLVWAMTTRPAMKLRRLIRVRLWAGRVSPAVRILYELWEHSDILAVQRASGQDIELFERQYGVVLPPDLREYFAAVNGTRIGECGRDDEYDVGFWHLGEVRTFAEIHIDDEPDDGVTFAFADYLLRFGTYGVRLSSDPQAPTPVVVRLPYGRFKVADSFGEFLSRYALGDTSVLFPEFSVVADGEGIGAEANGVTSYMVRWADVRMVMVEVVVPQDALVDPVPCWVITGSADAMPFIAPVDTVAGGHTVRARIRALPGFDEVAFERARQAEAQRTRGSFVVWQLASDIQGRPSE